jgi:3-methyladenine DNA glycosylase/8-oxoguanine DNA glycosylase
VAPPRPQRDCTLLLKMGNERSFAVPASYDLLLTFGQLQHGARDPSLQIGPGGVWRATRTPMGPATMHLVQERQTIEVRAWGPGSDWALEAAEDLLGINDDDSGFVPQHPMLGELWRRLRGLRMTRTRAVLEAAVPIVLEQKVPTAEALRAYLKLIDALGEPAPEQPTPGPAPSLLVPPSPEALAAAPYYLFHPFGIERRRAETIRRVAASASRLEEVTTMEPASARQRLLAIPGIGPWTAAKVALVALGDPDAVPLGDFHLPSEVAWVLAGEDKADDARMLDLLEPYRGHRGRVISLIKAAARVTGPGIRAPRQAPRARLRSFAKF